MGLPGTKVTFDQCVYGLKTKTSGQLVKKRMLINGRQTPFHFGIAPPSLNAILLFIGLLSTMPLGVGSCG